MAAQQFTDSELIKCIREGDERAFSEVFRTYAEPLIRYAATMLKDEDDAADIVQQLFVSIWDKKGLPDIHVSLKSYLYRSVHNHCLNKLKQMKVREGYANDVQAVSDGLIPGVHDIIENKEMGSRIQAALDTLPEQCRRIFSMSRLEQRKYQEIADQLGLSAKTVENQMGKALKLMREALKDYVLMWILPFTHLTKHKS